MASVTGVFLFHQELVEWTPGLVVKDIILFSNIFFFLPIPFWLGEKRFSSDSSSSARAEYFSSGSAFGMRSGWLNQGTFEALLRDFSDVVVMSLSSFP